MPVALSYEIGNYSYDARFCLEVNGKLLDLSDRVVCDVRTDSIVATVNLDDLFVPLKKMLGVKEGLRPGIEIYKTN